MASEISSLFAKHSSAFIGTGFGQITICEVLESTVGELFCVRLSFARLHYRLKLLSEKTLKGHNVMYNSSLGTPRRVIIAE